MYEVIKMTLGFTAIILVGISGVVISEVMKAGEVSSLIQTVDNITRVR